MFPNVFHCISLLNNGIGKLAMRASSGDSIFLCDSPDLFALSDWCFVRLHL
jgi:hypothetical protein